MPGDPRPIGVFDSGMGGLTVLRGNSSDQTPADTFNERFRRAIVQHRQLLTDFGGRLPAEPHVLCRREAVPALRDWRRRAERYAQEHGGDDRPCRLTFHESSHAGAECKVKTSSSSFFMACFSAELSSPIVLPVP